MCSSRKKCKRLSRRISHFISDHVRIITRALKDLWYWFRCHTFTRYHLIDARDKQNEYAWGYIDRDRLMLFACFKILRDYVDKELHPMVVDGWKDPDEETMKIYRLYDWWVEERPETIKSMNYLLDRQEYRTYSNLVHDLDEKDNEMLSELISLRETLWS